MTSRRGSTAGTATHVKRHPRNNGYMGVAEIYAIALQRPRRQQALSNLTDGIRRLACWWQRQGALARECDAWQQLAEARRKLLETELRSEAERRHELAREIRREQRLRKRLEAIQRRAAARTFAARRGDETPAALLPAPLLALPAPEARPLRLAPKLGNNGRLDNRLGSGDLAAHIVLWHDGPPCRMAK